MNIVEYRAILERRRERVVELTREGHTAPTIADILGCSVRTVQRIRTERGVSQALQFSPMTPDELAQAQRLLEDGCSYGEVARTLGRTHNTIARHFPGSGWSRGGGAWLSQEHRYWNRAHKTGIAL